MNLADDIYNSVTEPQKSVKPSSSPPQSTSRQATQSRPIPAQPTPSTAKHKMSRRAMMGASLAGLAGLGLGGIALEQWAQHGGLNTLLHGPMASNTQIGHLLRRAGFGANPAELAIYQELGYSGAVDRLINYSQISDNDTENRLKTLNLNL